MWIIISGNIVDGVSIIGPFKTLAKASYYSEYEMDGEAWFVTKLLDPIISTKGNGNGGDDGNI